MIENPTILKTFSNIAEYDKSTKSLTSTIDEILALDIPTNKSDTFRSDLGNRWRESGIEYGREKQEMRRIKSNRERVEYSCSQCEYQATRWGNLKLHLKSKHGGKTFSCNQCEYQATTQGNLKQHKQSKHVEPVRVVVKA